MLFRSSEYADYLLPAADWLERAECNLSASNVQPKPFVQFVDAVVPPRHERRDDWWIISRLLQEMGLPNGLDAPEPDMLARPRKIVAQHGLTLEAIRQMPGQSALLPQARPEDFFQTAVGHTDGKVDCCPATFGAAIERCAAIFQDLEREPRHGLKLISLRTNYMHNSNLANMPFLKRGAHALNPLHLNPDDAERLGLREGDAAIVSNAHGRKIGRAHV